MATGGLVKDLSEEATCPICLEYFKDPVTITECGHNFCQACVARCFSETGRVASCPQCRNPFQQRNLITNRQLASVAEISKKLTLQRETGSACESHQEPLKLFCKDHETPICLVCDRSKEHEGHKVVPLEEASQEYQDLIRHRLEILKKDREKILAYKADTERESQDLLKETKAEREKTVAEFRQLRQFLEEEERRLLARMEEVEKEIARKRDEHMGILSEELSSLESIIREMEEKCQQPARQLLQDVRSTLQRSEKETFENPVAFLPELKWRIWDFCDINPFLEVAMKRFKDALIHGLQLQKANITLDPDTAHPRLILSEDHKSVRMGDKRQDLPKNPERFRHEPFVLGREGFTTGRHFWEVLVGNQDLWAVGIARRSLRRKGRIDITREEGIWVVCYLDGAYQALNDSEYTFLPLNEELKRIRVSLNCAAGRVAFYDADRGTLLYAFSGPSFFRQTLLPLFYVFKDCPLRIVP